MRLTSRSEYALLALVFLTRHEGGDYVAVHAIAPAVSRLFDGALAPTESVSKYFYEATPVEREKALLRVFKGIRDYISENLEHTTLEDVA